MAVVNDVFGHDVVGFFHILQAFRHILYGRVF